MTAILWFFFASWHTAEKHLEFSPCINRLTSFSIFTVASRFIFVSSELVDPILSPWFNRHHCALCDCNTILRLRHKVEQGCKLETQWDPKLNDNSLRFWIETKPLVINFEKSAFIRRERTKVCTSKQEKKKLKLVFSRLTGWIRCSDTLGSSCCWWLNLLPKCRHFNQSLCFLPLPPSLSNSWSVIMIL